MTGEWRPSPEQLREGPTRSVVFHRAEGFYVIKVFDGEPLDVHAKLNPGTLFVTDLEDNILWEGRN